MFRTIINFLFGKKYTGIIDITPKDKLPAVNNLVQLPIIKFKAPYKISVLGKNLIKKYEGLKLVSYDDGGGVWTIGYGYTTNVKPGMMITPQKAEELLDLFLANQDTKLNLILKDVKLVSQEQYDIISSFVYNIGLSAFSKSTMLKKLKASDWKGAAEQFVWLDNKGNYHGWIYDNGKKIPGLINRRKSEKALFLKASNL